MLRRGDSDSYLLTRSVRSADKAAKDIDLNRLANNMPRSNRATADMLLR